MAIVSYKMFEADEQQHPVTSFIVGFPSGEVIETSYEVYTQLKADRLIKYDQKIDAFTFQDANYRRVIKYTIDKEKIGEIESALFRLGIDKYTINPDYSVDVHADVDITDMSLSRLSVRFRNIEGNFDCSYNRLENLVNAPEIVNGSFDCSLNSIYSLIGGPKIVKGGYYCSDNKLSDLQGFPEKVYVIFDAERNKITTLKGCPDVLLCNNFTVAQNGLTNLCNGPKIGYNFDCSMNSITSLENGIKELKGTFICTHNKLKTLIGMPHCERIIYRDGNNIKITD